MTVMASSSSSCAVNGGCATDYLAVAISIIAFILLIFQSTLPYIVHNISSAKGSNFWIPVIQVFASFNLLLSIVMFDNFLKSQNRHWWHWCYIWAAWVEGPLGFGLLMSCRIVQAFQLYFIFVKRRLPPIRSYYFLPLILVPWISVAAFIHMKKALNDRCHMGAQWFIPVICLHAVYVVFLIGFTGAIQHIEFRFGELKHLWRGILFSSSSIGIWVFAYVLNEIHEDIKWLQVASRFMLLVTASLLVLAFFSVSSSRPLLSQMSLKKRESFEFETMGQALGIPDSGLLSQRESTPNIDPDEPLEKLLLNKKFRHSFMAFADSCLAGESVHFYDEVHELGKIPIDDPVKRIYMARHILDRYITSGATMEVNISHKCRQEVLTTTDLAHPNLFNNALYELIHLMNTNLGRDYWSSTFYLNFKDEITTTPNGYETDHMIDWNFSPSPRLSSVHGGDDPFDYDHASKDSNYSGRDSDPF